MEDLYKCGHPKTDENTYYSKSRSGEITSKACKTCKKSQGKTKSYKPSSSISFNEMRILELNEKLDIAPAFLKDEIRQQIKSLMEKS